MPEIGYYEKRPRPEHRKWLVAALASRPVVDSVEVLDDFQIHVQRGGKSDVRVFLTNIYQLGVADVEEILMAAPETTCIVSTMDYNQYSEAAKETARERGIGLFRAGEFLGAIYYDGQRFLDYVSPREREERRRRGLT